ncbi:uncharacterized protein LOC127254411 [Andrographis paniculata]|uniref:uncharacterized protein LOC127254411 n=1 Tax=Andrographis paniculata TaxID=175694 RepID=UPI0021E8FBD5|nr:uncharacterized protein LOC127254411 [Andrographis paniculata]
MDQNIKVAKKFWKMIKVVYFMLRKGFSKAKLLANLNTMLKRGKIAGKAAMHHLIHHDGAASGGGGSHHHHEVELSYPMPLNEYEFSCSNTPKFHLPFHLNKRRRAAVRTPVPPSPDDDGDLFMEALEMVSSRMASPALPGFGRTPMARQLRITDSPFPIMDEDGGGGAAGRVDEAAEKFISKFYRELKQQK